MGAGSPQVVRFPWGLSRASGIRIFQGPRWTPGQLARYLARDLAPVVKRERSAVRLARRWVDANLDALMGVEDADTLFRELDRFSFEVEMPIKASYSKRVKEREARRRRERSQRVDSLRRRARRQDPGPVSTPVQGRHWASGGALPSPIFHATLAGHAVMGAGLMSRDQLWMAQRARAEAQGCRPSDISGLGGGPSDVVSFTPYEGRAEHIAAIFQALNEALRDPGPVVAWFDRQWRPALEEGWRRLEGGEGPARGRGAGRFVRELDAYKGRENPAWGAIYVKELINRTAQVAGHPSDLLDPVFTAPALMGGRPRAVAPSGIGVVTAYANVDQLVDLDGRRGRRGFLVSGIASDEGGGDADFRMGCPPGRGMERRDAWIGERTRRRWPWLERAAVASTTTNPYEANEIRVCPEDVTMVGFRPVLNWREVLMPRRHGSAKRSEGLSSLEAEIRRRWRLDDPLLEQRRRCVRAVYLRLEREALSGRRRGPLSRREVDRLVSRSFAICTASLQRGGYLKPGTAEPTAKGIAASLVKLGRRGGAPAGAPPVDPAERHAQYQEIIDARRVPRVDLEALFEEEVPRRGRGAANSCPLPGSRNTDIVSELGPLRDAMDEVFACQTAFGQCKDDYPSAGHCMLAAMVVQDLFGGEIMFGQVKGVPHYWNRVGARQVDITGDQFGGGRKKVRVRKGRLNGGGEPFSRRPGEQLTQPFNREVMQLHGKFVDRLVPVLRQRGMGEWAQVLAARQAA